MKAEATEFRCERKASDLLMDLTKSVAEGWRILSRKSCQVSGAVEEANTSPPLSISVVAEGRGERDCERERESEQPVNSETTREVVSFQMNFTLYMLVVDINEYKGFSDFIKLIMPSDDGVHQLTGIVTVIVHRVR